MRHIIFTLIISYPFNVFSNTNLELMDGTWDCEYATVSERFKYLFYGRSLSSFDVKTLSITSMTIADVKVNDDSVLKLNIKLKGNFSVEEDISTSIITDADINVVFGNLTDKQLDQFKQNMLNQKSYSRTIRIDDKEWISEDLEDGEQTFCKKI